MIILTLIKGLRKFQDDLNEGDNNIVNKNKIVSISLRKCMNNFLLYIW